MLYVSTLKQGRQKFSQRAHKSVFLGYSINKKGYKVYNLETITVLTSKDVIFHEGIFPYQIMHPQTQSQEVKHFFLPTQSEIITTHLPSHDLFDLEHDYTTILDEENDSPEENPSNNSIDSKESNQIEEEIMNNANTNVTYITDIPID